MHFARLFLYSFICALLSGCMVGPNFHHPLPPPIQTYTEPLEPQKTVSIPGAGSSGKAQHFLMGMDIPAQWWALFHCPELNALVEKGLEHSPNLAAAEAALTESEENLSAQIGTLFPTINAQASVQRQRLPGASNGGNFPSTIFTVYNVTASVSYTLDVFGGLRRQIEASQAQMYLQKFELEAAYLTLTSNIVTNVITEASLEAQIKATNQIVKALTQQLSIVSKQFRLGGASAINVFFQQTQLEQTRATLGPLQKQLAQTRDALAVLIGEYPSESEIPSFILDKIHLPAYLPISLPSLLVLQRPDIQAADAQLHTASAQIGVATANLFPQITLTASLGSQALSLNKLFSPAASAWSYGAQILQPIFHGGTLVSLRRAAIAAYEQAYAQYQETVLQGFQNVADSLRALQTDAIAFKAEKKAENAAYQTVKLTNGQFKLGGASFLSLLIAQQQYHQARINTIQAQANRYADTAALFQALGGGWWNREDMQ